MALLGHSLVDATAIGVGTPIFFDVPKSIVSMQVNVSGASAQWDVELQGTLDRVTWITLSNLQLSSNGSFIATGINNLVIGLRANLVEITDGTFNAFIAGA